MDEFMKSDLPGEVTVFALGSLLYTEEFFEKGNALEHVEFNRLKDGNIGIKCDYYYDGEKRHIEGSIETSEAIKPDYVVYSQIDRYGEGIPYRERREMKNDMFVVKPNNEIMRCTSSFTKDISYDPIYLTDDQIMDLGRRSIESKRM